MAKSKTPDTVFLFCDAQDNMYFILSEFHFCVVKLAMERIRMVLATGNLGKVREISQLIGDVVELIPYEGALPEETGTTYAENAYIKAKAAFDKYHLPSLADDSGLEVDFLGGQPGIHSNRFLGLKSDQEKYMKYWSF